MGQKATKINTVSFLEQFICNDQYYETEKYCLLAKTDNGVICQRTKLQTAYLTAGHWVNLTYPLWYGIKTPAKDMPVLFHFL